MQAKAGLKYLLWRFQRDFQVLYFFLSLNADQFDLVGFMKSAFRLALVKYCVNKFKLLSVFAAPLRGKCTVYFFEPSTRVQTLPVTICK